MQLNGADNVTIDCDAPNTAGVNRDLTISNTAAATVTANSVIRIATSAAVTSANNDTIKNCILNGNVTNGNLSTVTSTTGSSGVSFGIFAGGGGGATATGAPVALPATTTTGTAAPSTTTINALTIDNNVVNQAARGIVFSGAALGVSTGVTITNNAIGGAGTLTGNPPYTSPATTVYCKGISIAGTTAATVTGNTIRNVLSYVGNTMTGIELTSAIGTGALAIDSNSINGVVQNGTTGAAQGINLASATGTAYSVSNNTVNNVQTNAGSTIFGIQLSTTATSGTVEKNRVSTVYSRGTGGFGSYGINLGAGNAITLRNNFVSDVNAFLNNSAISSSFGAFGIRVAAGLNHKIYHNSVNLSGAFVGASTTSLSAAFEIIATGTTLTGIDVRNNIFANTMTGAVSPTPVVSVFLPSGGTSTMNLTLNNNGYYQGSGTGAAIGQVGTTSGTGVYPASGFNPSSTTGSTNLRTYTSTLLTANTNNDNASFASAVAPPFTSSTDLHINTGLSSTPLESGGATVGVATDIDNQVRPGPAGSTNGGATAPDIGADEFDGVPLFPNDMAATAFVDPTNGGLKPENVSFSPQASFTNVGTTTQTNVTVRYRIIANGPATVYNQTQVIASLAPNATTTVTFPATSLIAGAYTIKATAELVGDQSPGNDEITGTLTVQSPLCGNYNIGPAGDFTSLTNPGGAFAALNNLGASCSVTFSIVSDLTAETGGTAVNEWTEVGVGGYTLTIKPSGGAHAISGTSTGSGLITLNGADRVTIDGSLSGGTDRSLTITNLNTSGVVIWVASASVTNGANNDTVKNCVLSGASYATTIAGVLAGSGATLGNPADSPNSNITIQNNQMIKVQNAIYWNGNATTFDQNWLVTGNTFGSTVTAEKLAFRGMIAQNAANFSITNNTISGVVSTTASSATMTGIQLAASISGGTISGNKISDIKQTNTTGWGSNGIYLAATTTASNVLVSNNFIWDVASQGFNGVDTADNGYGIVAASGGGYKIYNNSINLNTNQVATGGNSAGLNVLAAFATVGGIDLRDNVFSDVETIGTRYGVLCSAAATVFSTIDYNDYFAQNVGLMGTTVQATILNWRTATGQDVNSLAADPLFVSATDLHLPTTGPASPVENVGLSLAAVTNDIDGDLRHPTTPDIGADEVRCHSGVDQSCNDNNACTVDSCVPATGCTNVVGNAGAVCRPAATSCDVAEICDGSSPTCPTDAFQPAATSCSGTSQGGACDNDAADHCAGTSSACVDAFQSGSVCRPSTGACDAAETCTGTSGACPIDAFEPSTTSCVGSTQGGACDDDAADHCSGDDASCLDAYKPDTVTCRPSAGACDAAETCTGSSSTCPVDAFEPATTSCIGSSQGGACDNDAADHCSGTADTCVDAYRANTFTCRPSAGPCDVAEACTGTSSTCPADAVAANGVVCLASTGVCAPADTCDGLTTGCTAVYAPNTTACNDGNACTLGDTCSGTGSCLPGTGTLTCNDQNPCTTDTCVPATGCQYTNNSNACDDGNVCTTSDFCSNGSCVGSGSTVVTPANMQGWILWDDSTDSPTGTATMVTGPATPPIRTGSARFLLNPSIADKQNLLLPTVYGGTRLDSITNLRYSTYRSSVDGGNNLAVTLAFDMDYDLTDAATPFSGRLVFEPYETFPGGVPQNTWQAWSPLAGKWYASRAPYNALCSQAVPCTWAQVLANWPNAGIGTVFSGVYLRAGSPWGAFDGNVDGLTIGVNGVNTTYDFEPASTLDTCDDGNACTIGDSCNGAICEPGVSTLDCNDSNPCTTDSCSPTTGCVHTNNTIACSDGNACTTGDTCSNGACQPGTGALNCDDSNPCTNDSCNPTSGCVHTNNSNSCNDGNACTYGDVCSGGVCAGTTITCANDQCNTRACNGTNSCSVVPLTGNACNDGNHCSQNDVCNNGVCAGSPIPAPTAINNSVRVNKTPTNTTIAWTDPPGSYNVYRGSKGSGAWTYNQGCLSTSVTGNSSQDTDIPLPNHFFYYLVTRVDTCNESTLGTNSAGVTRPNNSPCAIPADDDGDGVQNLTDNCPSVPNANQSDVDSDGVGDACDNCIFVSNFTQDDTDGDTIGDACDPDIDGDGVPNGIDNCVYVYNPDQADANNNNIGDACEPSRLKRPIK